MRRIMAVARAEFVTCCCRRQQGVFVPFHALAPNWTEGERDEFCAYIAENHEAGDVVAQSGGVRKLRWMRAGAGKSGGVRVLYFTRTEIGEVVLLTLYAKSKLGTLKASTLKELRNAIEKNR